MSEYILSCESTIDMDYNYVIDRNIDVIHYSYVLDDEVYQDDMGKDKNLLPFFYKTLKEGKLASTTQINQLEYKEYFMKLLEKTDNVIHIAFGSGLSGSVHNAIKVADYINSKNDGKKVIVIDSLCGSSGYGLLVDMAADLRDEGKSIEELKKWIEDNRLKIHHYVFTTDLTYLQRGGRVSKTEAVVGGILNIVPVIYMNQNGNLKVFERLRGKKKVIRKYIAMMKEYAIDGLNYNKKCFISHADSLDDAEELRDAIEENFKNLKGKVKIFNAGPVIGSHTGSGTVGVYFVGNTRPNLTKD